MNIELLIDVIITLVFFCAGLITIVLNNLDPNYVMDLVIFLFFFGFCIALVNYNHKGVKA